LVPARDEERNLPATLLSLVRQPAHEILVLDDGSSDATAAIVRSVSEVDSRVRLITGEPKPDGWIGKNWACHQLATQAEGELLAFADADVTLRPFALQAVWAQFQAQGADVLSVFPRQRTGTLGEALLAPLIDETLLGFLPHQLLRLPVPAAATANGQFLAFTRKAYEVTGGHAAVHGDIVEDIALARLTRRLGLRLGLALGGDLIQVRMYHGYSETVRGMGKSLRRAHAAAWRSGDASEPGRRIAGQLGSDVLLAASAALVLTAYTLPWLLPGPAWRLSAVLGLAQRILANAITGRGAAAEALLVPVTPFAALPVYAQAFKRTATWKGRDYP
jgi:hypothetical protein